MKINTRKKNLFLVLFLIAIVYIILININFYNFEQENVEAEQKLNFEDNLINVNEEFNLENIEESYVDAQVVAAGGLTCISLKCAWGAIDNVLTNTEEPIGSSGYSFCTPRTCSSGWADSGRGCSHVSPSNSGSVTWGGYCERWCCK